MEEFLGKEYIMVSEKNFDDYLVFMGIGYLSRKAAAKLKPIHCLVRNEDRTYTFTFKSKLASSEATFTPGKEFIETKANGVKVKSLITFEGNQMVHVQVEDNGRTSKDVRVFHPDKLIVTTTAIGFDKTVTRVFDVVQR